MVACRRFQHELVNIDPVVAADIQIDRIIANISPVLVARRRFYYIPVNISPVMVIAIILDLILSNITLVLLACRQFHYILTNIRCVLLLDVTLYHALATIGSVLPNIGPVLVAGIKIICIPIAVGYRRVVHSKRVRQRATRC